MKTADKLTLEEKKTLIGNVAWVAIMSFFAGFGLCALFVEALSK